MRLLLKSTNRLITIAAIALSLSTFFVLVSQQRTQALTARDFNAGRIIDDGVFYNKDSMNVQQIQEFLNRLIPTCDTWGTGASEYGGGTRAQYAASRGWHAPPYACLKNYHENPNNGETSYEKGGGAFSGGISAAQIIYNAAQQYGISPKVLLVMLKKESAGPLTADNWPLKSQYKYAMGYACPDSGPGYSANCSAEKSGFYKQMMLAAWQLKYYREHPNDYRYSLGWNSIQYSPTPSCGTQRVYIENIATLSLYIYTPYVPNNGALANYPGTAPCGAYGNRNFFMFYSEWFGSTNGSLFSKMDMSRKLVAKKDTVKINPVTGKVVVGQTILKNQVVEFSSKTSALSNNSLCLRTTSNTATDENMCVLYSDLEEGPNFSNLVTPTQLVAKEALLKIDPIDGSEIVNQRIQKNQVVEYSSRTYTRNNNEECLRTKSNTQTNLPACVLRSQLTSPPSFTPLSQIRNLVTTDNVHKINPITGERAVDQIIAKGMIVKYSSEIQTLKDNTRCFRTESNTNTGVNLCVPFAKLKEYVNPNFTNMLNQRALITKKETIKIDPNSGETIENLPANLSISFSQLTYHNGKLCLRTTTDQSLNKLTCVLYENIREL